VGVFETSAVLTGGVVQHVWLCENNNIKCMNLKINSLYTDLVLTSQRTHCTNDVRRNLSVHCRSHMQRVTSLRLDVMMWLQHVASLGLAVLLSALEAMPSIRMNN
jgi:hypothetical protein